MIIQIRTILSKEGISASQLAEKMGVQRSSISHILSERNKPSLDFIQKLMDAFPHINPQWIMSGNGNYKKETETKPITPAPTVSTPKPVTEPIPEPKTVPKPESKPDLFSQPNSLFSEIKRGTKKKAIKVITFYDDNTFDEYFPS